MKNKDLKRVCTQLRNFFSMYDCNINYYKAIVLDLIMADDSLTADDIIEKAGKLIMADIKNSIMNNNWAWLQDYFEFSLNDNKSNNLQVLNQFVNIMISWGIQVDKTLLSSILKACPFLDECIIGILQNKKNISLGSIEKIAKKGVLQQLLVDYVELKNMLSEEDDYENIDKYFSKIKAGGALKLYFQELNKVKILTLEEQKEAFQKLRKAESVIKEYTDVEEKEWYSAYNDALKIYKEEKRKIVESFLKLVIVIAKKSCFFEIDDDDIFLEYIQEGNMGLLRAIETYDYSFNCRFSTYARYWIEQKIGLYKINKKDVIRLPRKFKSKLLLVKKYIDEYRSINGDIPSLEMIQEKFKYSFDDVITIFSMLNQVQSLDVKIGTNFSGKEDMETMLVDQISDEDENVEEEVLGSTLKDTLNYFLSMIDPRHAEVLRLRYMDEMAYADIGKKLSVTHQRVRQIEQSAIKKLNDMKNIGILKQYWTDEGNDLAFVDCFLPAEYDLAMDTFNELDIELQHIIRARFGDNFDLINKDLSYKEIKDAYKAVQHLRTLVIQKMSTHNYARKREMKAL